MAKEMPIDEFLLGRLGRYDQDGALVITHFAPNTVTTACGAYILDGRAAWTEEPDLVEGCPACLTAAAQGDDQADNLPFCHCPSEVGGCPCYQLGYARGAEGEPRNSANP